MKKLFVVGCSVSDNLHQSEVYGNLIAQKLGYEYVHMAMGVGSNYRMWRYATKAVLNKNLTSEDLLIVQYTGTERCEIWSDIERIRPVEHVDQSEFYPKGGTILKFKWDAYLWQEDQLQKDFLKLYQERFLSPKFEDEKFMVHNYNFQCMLAYNNIRTVFFKSRANNIYNVIDRYSPYSYMEPSNFIKDTQYSVDPINDKFHMNALGHSTLADMLYKHILHTKVLES